LVIDKNYSEMHGQRNIKNSVCSYDVRKYLTVTGSVTETIKDNTRMS